MTDLDRSVERALDNAAENGHDAHGHPPGRIAEDLVTYDADLEGMDAEDLLPSIRRWQDRHP